LPYVKNYGTKYTVSQKNDIDVAHYNFNAHQPILVIFGRDVAFLSEYAIKWLFVIPLSLVVSLHYLGKHEPHKLSLFSHAVY